MTALRLEVAFRPQDASLPRLRFGRPYRLRVRTVNLAGSGQTVDGATALLDGLGGLPMEPVWWALSLGACLGGNGTLIGASANVVVAGIAEKNGFVISFKYYLKIAFPLMLLSIVISHGYLWLTYFYR